MSASPITRFFAPVRALVGLGLLLAAGAWAALLWSRVHGGEAISIMSLLLLGALALGAVAAFASAFPTGCRQCRKRFVETGAAFPSSQYEPLLEAIRQRKSSALRALADAPGSNSEA